MKELTYGEIARRNWSTMFTIWDGFEKAGGFDIRYSIRLITDYFDMHDPEFSAMVMGYYPGKLIDETMRCMVIEMGHNVGIAIRDKVAYDFVIDYILSAIFKKKEFRSAAHWFKPLPPNIDLIDKGYALFDPVIGFRDEKALRWFESYIVNHGPEFLPLFRQEVKPESEYEYWVKWNFMMGYYNVSRGIANGTFKTMIDADWWIREFLILPHQKSDNIHILSGAAP